MNASEMSDTELYFWLKLIRTQGVGPLTFQKLLESYGSAQVALQELPKLAKLKGRKIQIPNDKSIELELNWLQKHKAHIITFYHKAYPFLLKQIANPPPLLCAFGNLELLNKNKIAMVGARNASASAMRLTQTWSQHFAQNDYVVVSGLARGIDKCAHEAALSNGTIAVIAGGLGNIYPPENKKLYEKIAQDGLILSESPFLHEPKAHDFPRRNRIISGLSIATIVMEASLRSGSLITARFAMEQNREVMAIPGSPADPRSAGTNTLIKDGAYMALSAEDALSTVQKIPANAFAFQENSSTLMFKKSKDDIFLDEEDNTQDETTTSNSSAEPSILDALSTSPISLDELIIITNRPAREVNIEILELEMQNKIERLPGNKIVLKAS